MKKKYVKIGVFGAIAGALGILAFLLVKNKRSF